ncbi:Hypothetical protein R9X50_00549200 [Acrodontium crateriforme]|uniref:Uncharacterized protein n=1 Tax=Acrodontium crateriforme TaxID=150365 RepID=A0AAQ3MCM7_9PEZI|nr:Hypothetical protein R9X50_00549200 [Acrodontium crateriforme]
MHRLPCALRLRQQQQHLFTVPQPIGRLQVPKRHFISRIRGPQGPYERPYGNCYQQTSQRPIQQQNVRFKEPIFTVRRTLSFFVYTGIILSVTVWMLKRVPFEIVEEGEQQEGEEEDDIQLPEPDENGDIWAVEDSLFLPLTGMTKMPRTFYKGSDPEWQEFVKLAKDKARQKKIMGQLIKVVEDGMKKNPQFLQLMGKEGKAGKYWLDLSFPDGPPQVYRRSGVEFGDGYIAWVDQKVEPEQYGRIMRALWPTTTFNAVVSSFKLFAQLQYVRVAKYLGIEDMTTIVLPGGMAAILDLAQEEAKNSANAPQLPGSPTAIGAHQQQRQSAGETSGEGEQAGEKDGWFRVINPKDVALARLCFQAEMLQGSKTAKRKEEAPRGAVIVQGMVEMRSPRGMMLFDVRSFYDLKEAKFVGLGVGVRNFKQVHQRPKGGP